MITKEQREQMRAEVRLMEGEAAPFPLPGIASYVGHLLDALDESDAMCTALREQHAQAIMEMQEAKKMANEAMEAVREAREALLEERMGSDL